MCILFLLLANKTFANDTLLAYQYHTHADTSWMEVDTCLKYTNLAIPLFREIEDWDKYHYNLNALSYCYLRKDRYDDMLESNEFAFDEAQKRYTIKDFHYRVALNNLALSYRLHERYDEALAHFQSALNAIDPTSNENLLMGTLNENIGALHLETGDYGLAIDHLKRSAIQLHTHWEQHLSKDYPSFIRVAKVFQFLAEAYVKLEEYTAAEIALNEGIAILDVNSESPPNYKQELKTILIEVLINQEKYEQAEEQLHSVKSENLEDHTKALLLYREGKLYTKLEDYDAAIQSFEQSATLFPKAVHTRSFDALLGQGLAHSLNNEAALSNKILKKAKELIADGIAYDQYKWNKVKLQTLQNNYIQTGKLIHLENAVPIIEKLTTLPLYPFTELASSDSQALFLSELKSTNENALEILHTLQAKKEDSQLVDLAFSIIENSKSLILGMELWRREVLENKGYGELKRLKLKTNQFESSLSKAQEKVDTDSVRLSSLNDSLYVYKTKYKDALKALSDTEEGGINLLFKAPVKLEAYQSSLSLKQKSYNYLEASTDLFSIIVTKDKATFHRHAKADISHMIENMLANIRYENSNEINAFESASENILQALNIEDTKELIIYTDGFTNDLPFAALRLSNGKYLVEVSDIRYGYSATVDDLLDSKREVVSNKLWVEPFHLRASFPATFDSSDIMIGDEAKLESFRKAAKKVQLLHLSSHALAKHPQHNEPAILFVDSMLSYSALYSLDIDAELIVLSACESNLGQDKKGEGIESLNRGLSYHGVPSIVSTLWKVNASATHDILNSFYKYLERGETLDFALSQSQRDYLQTASDRSLSPYYWSGLTMYGSPSPVSTGLLPYRIAMFLIFSLLIFTFFNKAKPKG